jgi:hypothetical protein
MVDDTGAPIDRCLERWHAYARSPSPEQLDTLLHDEVVFSSPIVFTPQRGRDLTALYLTAATAVFMGAGPLAGEGGAAEPERFRYVREVRQGHDAVLEFESTIGDTYVNGVDMITCDDAGMIIDFKVMVRPLRAIEAAHQAMRALLERHSPG